jgi:hypothetical protein
LDDAMFTISLGDDKKTVRVSEAKIVAVAAPP